MCLGFSNEKLGGKKTGRKIFRVGVIKKLSKESIKHPDIVIPKFFEHTVTGTDEKVMIPVKVVEEGEIVVAVPDVKDAGFDSPKGPPYKGGSLIRNTDFIDVGCLGSNAQ